MEIMLTVGILIIFFFLVYFGKKVLALSALEERKEKEMKITDVEQNYNIKFEGNVFEWREDFVLFLKEHGTLLRKTRVEHDLSTLSPSTAKVADREDRSIISYKGATVLLIEKYEAGSETRDVPAYNQDQPGNPNPIGVIPEYYNFKRGVSEVPFLSQVTRRRSLLTEAEKEKFGDLFYIVI